MEECCQNGCNNCVLDQRQGDSRTSDTLGPNLLTNSYLKYNVISIERCTSNVFKMAFKLLDINQEDGVIDIPPGWHMQLRAPRQHGSAVSPIFAEFMHPDTTDTGKSIREQHDTTTEDCYMSRPYTPTLLDKRGHTFEVLFKLEPNGAMTRYIQTLRLNDCVEWKGPHGSWEIDPTFKSHLLGFCQGVAVAPLFSIAKAILDDEDNDTRIHLICCFADLDNVLLRKEMKDMTSFWNFDLTTFLARQRCTCGSCEDLACARRRLFYKERVKFQRMLEKDIASFVEKLHADSTFILICGTPRFSQFITSSLQRLGFNKFHVL
jgi:cytochrome-b5 reductase